jgi:hypothetical protein
MARKERDMDLLLDGKLASWEARATGEGKGGGGEREREREKQHEKWAMGHFLYPRGDCLHANLERGNGVRDKGDRLAWLSSSNSPSYVRPTRGAMLVDYDR